MERTNIYENNAPAPDGKKHKFLMYDYGEYQFRKEWYMNYEDEFVMGLTLFKNNNEILHCGRANDSRTDDEWIDFAGKIRSKDFLDKVLGDEK